MHVSLHFVDQHRRRKTLHEQGLVALGKGQHQRIVQSDVGSLRFTYPAQKGCLADLAGTGDQQYRELPGSFLEPDLESACEIHGRPPIVHVASVAIQTIGGCCVNGFKEIGDAYFSLELIILEA